MANRLERLAMRVRIALWGAIVLLVLTPTANWLLPGMIDGGLGMRLVAGGLSAEQRWLGWLIVMPPYLNVAFGLAQLVGFCRRIERRQTFSLAGVAAVRRLGWSLIAASATLPLTRVVVRLTVLADAPLGPGMLAGILWILPVAVGAAFGVVFVAFAAVLGEAVRLAEENERFV